MNINLHNYESWFHLYVDGELDGEQMAAVEAFAAQYPHHGEALEQLMQTILPAPQLEMPNKDKLLRPEQWDAEHLTEEQLHLLNQLESGALTHAADAESALLQRTILQPEFISMPGKDKLYRKADTRRPATIWNLTLLKRVAAAAAVVAIAWALWPASNQGNSLAPTTDVADTKATDTKAPTQSGNTGVATAVAKGDTNPAVENNGQGPKPRGTNQQATDMVVTGTPQQQAAQDLITYQAPAINTTTEPQTGITTTEPIVAIAEPVQPAETLIAETTTDEPIDAMPNDAEVGEEEYVNVGGVKIKKSRFRGLVRSVSRNVSRRTTSEQLQQAILPR